MANRNEIEAAFVPHEEKKENKKCNQRRETMMQSKLTALW